MSASAQPPASLSAVVAGLQARHATALRSYALELWSGEAARADESCAAFWREWAQAPLPTTADSARETLFAALRRGIVAVQRRAGARAETESGSEPDAEDNNASASERVARRFRQLTPKQQEVLRLRLRHGFDAAEIAHITELSLAAVEQLIHHALGRLAGGGNDDPRLTRLALGGATNEETAGETPADRARIAELRLTLEVTRQTLARGVDRPLARKRRARRRTGLIAGALGGVVLLAVAVWWWRGRELVRVDAPEPVRAEGRTRVAIRRADGPKAKQSIHAGGETESGFSTHTRSTPARSVRAPRAASETSGGAGETPEQASPALQSAAVYGRVPVGPVSPAAPLRAQPERATTVEPAAERRESPPVSAAAEPSRPSGSAGATRWTESTAPLAAVTLPGRAVAEAANEPPAALPAAPSDSASRRALAADRVDTAPIAALRKALGAARWPARQDVRVGALVHAAPPSAPPPQAEVGMFSAQVESSESPWHPERRLVRVALRARETAAATRAPATVILLLDVSGSMDAPNRLPLVQEAVAALLRRLQPEDRVGVVTYAGESRVLLPPTPLAREREIRAAVAALEAKGRTNGGAGLREAFAMAEADGRAHGEHMVILCTDGNFNMGETSEVELGALIDRHRDEDVRLAIFGFGRADRIDARLEALAARARGGSGYVNTRAEAEAALVAQLDGLFAPVAEKLEVSVEFDPTRVTRCRAVGETGWRDVTGGAEVPVAARERVLPGEEVSALFEVEPVPGSAGAAGAADLRVRVAYREVAAEAPAPPRRVWPARVDGGTWAEASVDFRFAAAMAAFGEALQAGPEAGALRLDEIARWARDAVGDDAGGYRAELIALIEQARRAGGG